MWQKVKSFLSDQTVQPEALTDTQNLRVATAALLVHAAFADDDYSAAEHEKLRQVLQQKFGLEDSDVHNLIESAQHEFSDAVDLYGFVRVINENFDNEGRQEIVKQLWEIILADGRVDNYEDSLIRKVCSLLGVSPRDKVRMRNEAMK